MATVPDPAPDTSEAIPATRPCEKRVGADFLFELDVPARRTQGPDVARRHEAGVRWIGEEVCVLVVRNVIGGEIAALVDRGKIGGPMNGNGIGNRGVCVSTSSAAHSGLSSTIMSSRLGEIDTG